MIQKIIMHMVIQFLNMVRVAQSFIYFFEIGIQSILLNITFMHDRNPLPTHERRRPEQAEDSGGMSSSMPPRRQY